MKDPEVDVKYEYPYTYPTINTTTDTATTTINPTSTNTNTNTNSNTNTNGSVVFVNHYDDFLTVLMDLVTTNDDQRVSIEQQAYNHYYNGIAKDIGSLDVATKHAIKTMQNMQTLN